MVWFDPGEVGRLRAAARSQGGLDPEARKALALFEAESIRKKADDQEAMEPLSPVGAARPLDCTWLWAFLLLGRPIPGGRWHEFAGRTLDVSARGGETLEPVIDGEMFGGFDRVRLGLGPKVLMPTL